MKLASCLICIGLALGLTACMANSNPKGDPRRDLVIFAAASLTDSFTELATVFEAQNPGINLVLHFASSAQLAAQLNEGVSADIFASANQLQMQAAIESQRVELRDVQPFAANTLTVVVPVGNPAGIQSLYDLGGAGVALLMAVPGVPVRDYADQMIANLPPSIQDSIYQNLMSEESNVRQVATKVALGEADAGIVYRSDITPDIADRIEQVEIPEALNVMAAYPLAVIADTAHKELADDFVGFVISQDGQVILIQWGFTPILNTEKTY
jgi:molybdate transport system substrate-binding protein